MEELVNSKSAEEVVAEAYVDLAKYTAKTRNYPSLIDGMKAAYRRLVYQSSKYTKRVKSAVLVGELLKIHPHGDESAYSVLVESTCRYNNFPLFDGKGNFGGLGFGSSAMRYTEAVLSDIARLLYLDLIDYAEYEDGEVNNVEPKYLPALIPYCFLQGCSGFSVGMAAPNILPLNSLDLVNYYINLLEGKEAEYPSPDYGSVIIDCDKLEHSDYLLKTGNGTLWFEPYVIQEDFNKFVVTEVTPNSNMGRVNKKLAWALDQGWVDFSDETNESGYRFVYTINNFNKVSTDDVKNAIIGGLHCSMSYRFIFEYNSKVYICNFDYVIKNQLKYLRECVIRKFVDYLNKSKSKSNVFNAINKLRNDEELVLSLHKKDASELKDIIMSWGFNEDTAKDVINKPISYLTKSHDSELEKEKLNQINYSEYIDNPNKYLLELYYKLKELILKIYPNKSHSIFKNNLSIINDNKCSLSENHKFISFGKNESVNWNNMIYAITKYGFINSISVNKLNSSNVDLPELEDNDEFISVLSDDYNYIVFIIDRHHIYVIPKNKISSGIRSYIKLWSNEYPVKYVIGCKNEDLVFIDSKNHEIKIHLNDFVKSRISKPQYLTGNNLMYYLDEDRGDKVEIEIGI